MLTRAEGVEHDANDGGQDERGAGDADDVQMSDDHESAFAAGSLVGSLLRIALPLALGGAVRYGVELSNAYWVGQLGVASLSIVTALGTFLSLSKMFAGITSAGTSAVVGRMMGAGRRGDAVRTAQRVTAVALALGAVVAVFGLAFSGWALDALAFSGAKRVLASRYLYVLLAGLPLAFGNMAMNAVLVGLGRARASMIASGSTFVLAFFATPLLVRGTPAGLVGAAIAQIGGDALGYAVGLAALGKIAGRNRIPWRERFRSLRDLWPVVRIGAPLTADAVIHGAVWFGLIAMLSRYGDEYVAAQGVEERIGQILNVPTEGVAPAAATLVGYMLGQNRKREALRVVWLAVAIVGTFTAVGAALLRFTPAPVVGWLCSDPSFVHVGAKVLAIASLGLMFASGRDVFEAAFGGLGSTVPPVVVGLVVALSRLPLAYLLSVRLGHGGLGVAWTVNITVAVQTVVLGAWFVTRFDRTTQGSRSTS